MNNPAIIAELGKYPNLIYKFGTSESKVHAINRDLESLQGFDIIICFSDDMRFVIHGWDVLIRDAFKGTDGDLLMHFPDNDAKENLATMYIAGVPFYNRFGYIYNPAYWSLFCDNEIMEIAQSIGKYKLVQQTIYHHLCPAYGHLPEDKMFRTQQDIGYSHDQPLYFERRKNGFPMKDILKPKTTPLLTIMLPTTIDRRELFLKLLTKLGNQTRWWDSNTIEVIWDEDNKQKSIGRKRQELLVRARGTFVVGIDSDDDIADCYVNDIIVALLENPDTDHVGFYEHCTFDGINPKRSIFSIKYKSWGENIDGHDHIRCANPKSVIRREKALQVGYCDCRYGEDIKFSEAVTPLLKSEVFIEKELYLYRYTTQEHDFKYGIKNTPFGTTK